MKGVDVFAGAGGMSVGAIWAGVDVRVAVEFEENAANTYSVNHPGTDVLCTDISKISDFSKLRPKGEIVLFGGPPCQGFSTSNQRTRNLENENNWLFKEFLRAVKQLSPEWVVFENVRGITETEGAIFLEYVLKGLTALGYSYKYDVLNAKDFGVAQNRSRLFVIATNTNSDLAFPIHSLKKHVSVKDALEDLPILENGANIDVMHYRGDASSSYARKLRKRRKSCDGHLVTRNAPHILDRYKFVPQGGNWQNIPEDMMATYSDRSRCHTGIYKRLKWDEPSTVIGNYRKNMLIHPNQDRGLSVREAARLQSFPDSYKFTGTIGFRQQQVGNAVPPMLAENIFKNLG